MTCKILKVGGLTLHLRVYVISLFVRRQATLATKLGASTYLQLNKITNKFIELFVFCRYYIYLNKWAIFCLFLPNFLNYPTPTTPNVVVLTVLTTKDFDKIETK